MESLSYRFLKKRVKEKIRETWILAWSTAKKGQYYTQYQTNPMSTRYKELYHTDRLTFTTWMQLKLGHGYFKSYLYRLPQYTSRECHQHCQATQSPEHLMLHCRRYYIERQQLYHDTTLKPQNISLRALFQTRKGVKGLLIFLKATRLATRNGF